MPAAYCLTAQHTRVACDACAHTCTMGNAASVACIAGASAGLVVATSYEAIRLLLKKNGKGAASTHAADNELACVHSEVMETSRKMEQLMALTQSINRVLARCNEMGMEKSTEKVECAIVAFQDIARKLNSDGLTWANPGIEDINANVRRVLELATHANRVLDTASTRPPANQLAIVAEATREMEVLDSIDANTKRILDLIASTRYPNEEQAQKAMVALADTVANVESIVTQKLPMIENAILEITKRVAATGDAISQLPEWDRKDGRKVLYPSSQGARRAAQAFVSRDT